MLSTASTEGPPIHGELDAHRRRLRGLQRRVREEMASLEDHQARFRPQPGSWSVAECIEHLNVTAEAYVPALREQIREAWRRKEHNRPPAHFRQGILGPMFRRLLAPPPKFRMKAPGAFKPHEAEAEPPEEIFRRFDELHDALVSRIEETDGLDAGRVMMSSPFLSLLRLSLDQWFAFLVVHEERHLWQARQVMENPEFPEPRS